MSIELAEESQRQAPVERPTVGEAITGNANTQQTKEGGAA